MIARQIPLWSLSLLVACGTADRRPPVSAWTALFPDVVVHEPGARQLTRTGTNEQMLAVDRAVRVYIDADDEEFAKVRDEVARDPVQAYWLTRYLVMFVEKARERAANTDLREAKLAVGDEPVWSRPIRHIKALGAAAVPVVVLELLRSPVSDRVELGRELLREIGPEALPAWRDVFGIDEPRMRRRCANVLADWGTEHPAVREMLMTLRTDDEFGVRAAAYRGLASDPANVDLLVDALMRDPDPFVQRTIAVALGGHYSRQTAGALVDFMSRAVEASDYRAVLAADEALRKMSGRAERADLRTWRTWLTTVRDE